MDTLFMRLLNMSITASFLIMAIILVRPLMNRIPKRITCILWGFAAIRLALPLAIESRVSVIPNLTGLSKLLPLGQAAPANSMNSLGGVVNGTGGSLLPNAFPASTLPGTSPSVSSMSMTGVSGIDLLSTPLHAAMAIWLIGFLVLGVFCLLTYLKIARQVANAIPVERNLYRCDAIDTPFVLGLFRPRIYLPFSLDESSLFHVIAHEEVHIERRDHWIKPFGFLLLMLHWFNPLVWLAYVLLCRDIEMACDERVLERIGSGQKKAYSNALLTCSVRRSRIAACPVAFGEIGVKQRVRNVLNYKKPAFWIIGFAAIISVAIAVGFLTDPIDPVTASASVNPGLASSGTYRTSLTVEREVPITAALDKAVASAILAKNEDNYISGECSGEGHRILQAAESTGPSGQKLLKAFALSSFGTFEFLNGRLIVAGGNTLIPTVLTFNVESDGTLAVIDYREARDGSERTPSIREMFPASIQQVVLNPGEEIRVELNRQRNNYAIEYMQKLGGQGRTYFVGDLSDFEDDFMPLSHFLSTSVSNSLLKEYGDYPAFISPQGFFGIRECIENGMRVLYEVRWDESGFRKGQLTFRKSMVDSQKVVSNVVYTIDGDEYQRYVQTTKPLGRSLAPEVEQAMAIVRAHYAALAAKDREALRQTLIERHPLADAPFGAGLTELLDVRFHSEDQMRISSDGSHMLEFRGEPSNVIVIRADLKITDPTAKDDSVAPLIQNNRIIYLARNGQDAPWRIDHIEN